MTSHWLMKSEPDVYSIDDLARDGSTTWEGVRNFTARNFMRDGMKLDDLVLFYHSNAEPSGVAGVAKVRKLAYPDPTQFDRKSEYFDPTAPADGSRWLMVEVAFVEKLPTLVSLEALKNEKTLAKMLVVQKGQRLSVQPVDPEHFERVVTMGRASAPAAETVVRAKEREKAPPKKAQPKKAQPKKAQPKKAPPKKKG